MYRQGDVLLEAIDELPENESSTETLLVRGEGRNHGHFIEGEEVLVLKAGENEITDGGGLVTQYLDIKSQAKLVHLYIDSSVWTKEHAPIHIPPGKYRVIKQREFNPYARAIRAVKD